MKGCLKGCGCILACGWIIAIVAAAVTLVISGCAHFRQDPWIPIAASAQLKVVNTSDQPCPVVVDAEDGRHWTPGSVAPHDSVTWRLPVADEKVVVQVCGFKAQFTVDGPYTWTARTTLKQQTRSTE